ncbi:MAG: YdcF family protein [Proteobacteria bacterium]|nr:YdcF family protein [Pseudomonadota bacterium]
MKNRIYIASAVLLCIYTLFQFYAFVGSVSSFGAGEESGTVALQPTKTDAIVVLTGGQGRIDKGLALLREGKSSKLILSGVNSESSHDAIFRNGLVDGEQYRIILEKRSTSTYENALEMKRLVTELDIESITLITSSYHMKRAYTAFDRMMPEGVRIEPYTISTPNFDTEHWWAPDNIAVALPEFLKYYWYEIRFNMDSTTA